MTASRPQRVIPESAFALIRDLNGRSVKFFKMTDTPQAAFRDDDGEAA